MYRTFKRKSRLRDIAALSHHLANANHSTMMSSLLRHGFNAAKRSVVAPSNDIKTSSMVCRGMSDKVSSTTSAVRFIFNDVLRSN
jgi:hypothetical protein